MLIHHLRKDLDSRVMLEFQDGICALAPKPNERASLFAVWVMNRISRATVRILYESIVSVHIPCSLAFPLRYNNDAPVTVSP
jgi:hypothetical protein